VGVTPLEPNPSLVCVIKINVTNIGDMTADVNVDMAVEVYDDVAIMTHLFIGQYQKWSMQFN
jgi:hypothetical protein